MKINLNYPLGLCLLLSVTFTYAQKAKTLMGKTHRMSVKEGGWSDIDGIGQDETGLYYLLYPFSKVYSGAYIGNKDTYVGKVNNQMELERFELLPLDYEDKQLELEFGFQLGDQIYLFSSFQNNLLKKTFLFAQTLNKSTLTPNPDLIPVAEIDYSGEGRYKNASFSYKLSDDNSQVLLIHNLLDKDGSLLSFGYSVIDSQLKTIDKVDDIELKADGIYSFQDFYLSPSAEVYMLTKFFDEKKEYKHSVQLKKQGVLSSTRSFELEAIYDFKVLKFSKGSPTPKALTLSLGDLFITSLDLKPKKDGGLMIIGFYSQDEDAVADGVFTQTIDKTLTKTLSTDKKSLEGEFDQPSKYTNDTYVTGLLGKRDDLDQYRFVMKDILQKTSGGYALTAERNATLEKTQNDGRSITTYNVYHTDDIVAIDVSPTGKINWVNKIEKAQETSGLLTLFSSYDVAEYEDNLIFFFTDFSSQNTKALGKIIDTESVMVKVNASGEQTRQTLLSASEDKITVKAKNTYQPQKGRYILYGHNGQLIVGFTEVKF